MKTLLNHMYEQNTLPKPEAKETLKKIAEGKYNELEVSSFLTVFNIRGITVEELSGFRKTLLELCVKVDLNAYNPIDLFGTGNTFSKMGVFKRPVRSVIDAKRIFLQKEKGFQTKQNGTTLKITLLLHKN